ncbi:50S ribosomal protein L28 [Spiroplasma endosymbiont of 'Nebria riversi']|uniref:50S ribosomal protein L28 n=1 Tax=Spiroplasma endosymbiont of 'Nebria riversi' TaxID=2792084 RepID=UPI001C0425C2|nr:50S ribosomal protein L28 [Spiroplasma endosymbiont of 'Nebria riversi']
MSRKCEITGKSVLSGNKRSHAMNASRRKWNVNLQTVKVEIDGQVKKVKMSTRALRTLKRKRI